jgi:hypothetical protein
MQGLMVSTAFTGGIKVQQWLVNNNFQEALDGTDHIHWPFIYGNKLVNGSGIF